jgi:hypothetical protein
VVMLMVMSVIVGLLRLCWSRGFGIRRGFDSVFC